MNLGGKLQTQALGGATQEQINVATQPIPYSSINLYNPESGLASFLLPAILVLILQQSLILGIGMMAGEFMNIDSYTCFTVDENICTIMYCIW